VRLRLRKTRDNILASMRLFIKGFWDISYESAHQGCEEN
jgi:hypothetical protein